MIQTDALHACVRWGHAYGDFYSWGLGAHSPLPSCVQRCKSKTVCLTASAVDEPLSEDFNTSLEWDFVSGQIF